MKRVRGLETDDIRICVSEMMEIEKRQDALRLMLAASSCEHFVWDFLNCDDCADAEIECNGRICLDCSEVWEED